MNQPLQQRAGRNSPIQNVAPSFESIVGFHKVLPASAAPGSAVQLAAGADKLFSVGGLNLFMGANAGLAALSVVGQLRDPGGNVVVATPPGILGPGPNTSTSISFGGSLALLPEGYTVWLNVELTAGVYGGDAVASWSLAEAAYLTTFGPIDLSTTLQEIAKADAGHALFSQYISQVYNSDSVNHDIEVYLSENNVDVLTAVVTVNAGQMVTNIIGAGSAVLNAGQSVKMKLVAPVTPGKAVNIYALVPESNQFVY